jgi:hypothetical protein
MAASGHSRSWSIREIFQVLRGRGKARKSEIVANRKQTSFYFIEKLGLGKCIVTKS